MFDRQTLVPLYDEAVAALGAPTVEQAREAFCEQYVADVAAGRIARQEPSLRGEALSAWREVIEPERKKRRASFLMQIDLLSDSILNPADGANIDPMMGLAFPVSDGTDKTFSEWTPDDFGKAIVTRYRGAAEQTAAASEFDASANRLIQIMASRGVSRVGDLA